MSVSFIVYADGATNVTNADTLEEARAGVDEDEKEKIVAHVTHSCDDEDDNGINIIMGAHYLALAGIVDSSLEQLATTLVRSGMEIERRKMRDCIERIMKE